MSWEGDDDMDNALDLWAKCCVYFVIDDGDCQATAIPAIPSTNNSIIDGVFLAESCFDENAIAEVENRILPL